MKNRGLLLHVAAFAALLMTLPHANAADPARKSTVVDKTAQTSLRKVEYAELEHHVGSKLVIRTTNNTTRNGTLTRYTGVNITIQLGADSGAIELVVPRNTIREAHLEIAPADPLFPNEKSPHEGKSGAQKN